MTQSTLSTAPATASAIELEDRWGAHNYHPLPVVLTRGEGVYLWDEQGRRYLDMMSAYSAVSFGHSRPELVEALTQQAQRLAITSRAYHTDRLGPFLEKLCRLTGLARALPMNTGAEAVETAIKAARKWGYRVKGVPQGQAQIIVAAGNFAGRTTTIVGFSSEAQYRDGFGPFAPGFVEVPYGDVAALERAITPHTAAFLVEPIQGEAGIVVPPAGYLRAVRELCTRHRVLLICDEVQTGLGRTGRVLACEHEGVLPDAVTLGKALGGGLLPVSAFVAREDVMSVFGPGDHGSTFGGNPLAAAVGLAALELLEREGLSEQAERQGRYLRERLLALQHPAVREVRGKGLLVGVEIDPRFASARAVCEALMAEGVLSKDTHHTVVRLAPPLVITGAQIDSAVAALGRALRSVEPDSRLAA
ncbi:ornithine--oxo-acid transaminase [Aquabacterium sp. A7-Y]|uniref:ornithine--oxo-acid transaminase n=1 Tax=Aquabacterium sp. A7-Y TaxID=1349605 RepID=UPI00223DECDE|nr:ornithine--oxo-acid transaminase [Aquabacterium sp. A7-Y]MCW7539011.1 ornithine--oxo-acid transaminase [Aquabacterium sp. A7-Y]